MLIDVADLPLFSQGSWYAYPSPPTGKMYARQNRFVGGKWVARVAHRVILGAPKGMMVDHINGDTLDNRRANLRLCSRTQNNWNRRMDRTNRSGFKGVSWCRQTKRWKAQISVSGHKRGLGYFEDKLDAARAYDAAANEDHPGFALTNAGMGLL